FNNDIGFYVFSLPFFKFLLGWAIGLIILTAIGAGVIYFLTSGLSQIARELGETGRAAIGGFSLDKRIGTHLSVLGAIFLLLLAVGYWFGRYDLFYSSRAV